MKRLRVERFIVFFLSVAALFGVSGCMSEVSVRQASAQERMSYDDAFSGDGISSETGNLLGNFLLNEVYEQKPEEAVRQLEEIFRNEPRPEYLAALADISLNGGIRFRKDSDLAVRYYLSAALYSYAFLRALDRPGENPYNAERIRVMQTYNMALAEVFSYLRSRGILRNSSFSINTIGGQRVTFAAPEYELPLAPENFLDFELCADYRPENLTHISREFGIGVPLICRTEMEDDSVFASFADVRALPATAVLKFDLRRNDAGIIDGRMHFINSRDIEKTRVGEHEVPLARDFSTPLAYMVRNPLPFGYLGYMLRPGETRKMQGLYMLEPYREDRIPIVLVHGLMSNIRTWVQLINTLQSDPVLREHYQFWGFSYSSGNPVLYSAKLLRDALEEEAARIRLSGRSDVMFNRMVLVGHSMGGLLSKTAIMNSGDRLIQPLFGENPREELAKLTPEQRDFVSKMLRFEALPFVRRVVFVCVPHRGSEMARSWIARLGASLIQLPGSLVLRGEGLIGMLIRDGKLMPDDSRKVTGIDNLDPGNTALRVLDSIPFVEGVPFHSIIGNVREAEIPGGSDGVVPYSSSHLDGAASELVVRSGHSAQQNPLAIQELRRILLLHLQQYPDLKVKLPTLPTISVKAGSGDE